MGCSVPQLLEECTWSLQRLAGGSRLRSLLSQQRSHRIQVQYERIIESDPLPEREFVDCVQAPAKIMPLDLHAVEALTQCFLLQQGRCTLTKHTQMEVAATREQSAKEEVEVGEQRDAQAAKEAAAASTRAKELEIDAPEEYFCPISHELMCDPVMCLDGHTYERAQIEQWLSVHDTSPLTNVDLPSKLLVENRLVKQMIQGWLNTH